MSPKAGIVLLALLLGLAGCSKPARPPSTEAQSRKNLPVSAVLDPALRDVPFEYWCAPLPGSATAVKMLLDLDPSPREDPRVQLARQIETGQAVARARALSEATLSTPNLQEAQQRYRPTLRAMAEKDHLARFSPRQWQEFKRVEDAALVDTAQAFQRVQLPSGMLAAGDSAQVKQVASADWRRDEIEDADRTGMRFRVEWYFQDLAKLLIESRDMSWPPGAGRAFDERRGALESIANQGKYYSPAPGADPVPLDYGTVCEVVAAYRGAK